MSLLRGLFERRSVSFQDVFGSGGTWAGGARTYAGKNVDSAQALRLIAVHACVTLISETVAALPFGPVETVGGIRTPVPQPGWMVSPNDEDSPVEFVESVVTSLLLDGNAYIEVVAAGRSLEPVSLGVIDPTSVTPVRRDGRKQFDVIVSGGQTVTAPAYTRGVDSGVLHIKGHRLPGSLKGGSPIERARQGIGLGLVTEEYGARFFGQGTHAGGVIEIDGPMTNEDVSRLKDGWESHHSSPGKAHRPGILTDGAKWKQTTIPPEHAQFLQTRSFQVSEIARLYRVPPHMIGDVEKSTSWGTGIEEQGIGFVTYTLGAHIARLEQRFGQLLPPGQAAKFNVNGLLRGDSKSRFDAYAIARQWGWLSVNDIRRLEDLPPVTGGETYLSPMNMEPLDTVDTPLSP